MHNLMITELNGNKLKKDIDVKSSCFTYHYKHKWGGNFKIDIRSNDDRNYELIGEYNKEKKIKILRFGFIFRARITSKIESYDDLVKYIINFMRDEK